MTILLRQKSTGRFLAADGVSWTADPTAARHLKTVRDAVRLLALVQCPAEVFHDFGDSRHTLTLPLNSAFWWEPRPPNPHAALSPQIPEPEPPGSPASNLPEPSRAPGNTQGTQSAI